MHDHVEARNPCGFQRSTRLPEHVAAAQPCRIANQIMYLMLALAQHRGDRLADESAGAADQHFHRIILFRIILRPFRIG